MSASALRGALRRSGEVLLAGGLLAWDLWVSPAGMRVRGEEVRDGLVTTVVLLAVASCAPLLLRRRHPIPVLAATTAVMILGFELEPEETNGWLILGVWVALYTVGRLRDWRTVAATTAVLLAILGVDSFTGRDTDTVAEYLDTLPLVVLLFTAVAALGLIAGWRARERDRALARAGEQARERERRAVGVERARIARELHDVVAHHVSSIVVQAGAAHRVYDEDPEGARSALASIRATGSETLVAMRRLLGILRSPDGAADLAPQAGLAQIGPLVGHFRQLGLTVTFTSAGVVRAIPVDVDLSAYRVVQEALTNVMKHAGPTRVGVEVRYGDWFLEVRVDDDGPVAAGSADGAGQGGLGLIGMRERMALYSGTLQAGARGGGGWTVRARFPLPDGPGR